MAADVVGSAEVTIEPGGLDAFERALADGVDKGLEKSRRVLLDFDKGIVQANKDLKVTAGLVAKIDFRPQTRQVKELGGNVRQLAAEVRNLSLQVSTELGRNVRGVGVDLRSALATAREFTAEIRAAVEASKGLRSIDVSIGGNVGALIAEFTRLDTTITGVAAGIDRTNTRARALQISLGAVATAGDDMGRRLNADFDSATASAGDLLASLVDVGDALRANTGDADLFAAGLGRTRTQASTAALAVRALNAEIARLPKTGVDIEIRTTPVGAAGAAGGPGAAGAAGADGGSGAGIGIGLLAGLLPARAIAAGVDEITRAVRDLRGGLGGIGGGAGPGGGGDSDPFGSLGAGIADAIAQTGEFEVRVERASVAVRRLRDNINDISSDPINDLNNAVDKVAKNAAEAASFISAIQGFGQTVSQLMSLTGAFPGEDDTGTLAHYRSEVERLTAAYQVFEDAAIDLRVTMRRESPTFDELSDRYGSMVDQVITASHELQREFDETFASFTGAGTAATADEYDRLAHSISTLANEIDDLRDLREEIEALSTDAQVDEITELAEAFSELMVRAERFDEAISGEMLEDVSLNGIDDIQQALSRLEGRYEELGFTVEDLEFRIAELNELWMFSTGTDFLGDEIEAFRSLQAEVSNLEGRLEEMRDGAAGGLFDVDEFGFAIDELRDEIIGVLSDIQRIGTGFAPLDDEADSVTRDMHQMLEALEEIETAVELNQTGFLALSADARAGFRLIAHEIEGVRDRLAGQNQLIRETGLEYHGLIDIVDRLRRIQGEVTDREGFESLAAAVREVDDLFDSVLVTAVGIEHAQLFHSAVENLRELRRLFGSAGVEGDHLQNLIDLSDALETAINSDSRAVRDFRDEVNLLAVSVERIASENGFGTLIGGFDAGFNRPSGDRSAGAGLTEQSIGAHELTERIRREANQGFVSINAEIRQELEVLANVFSDAFTSFNDASDIRISDTPIRALVLLREAAINARDTFGMLFPFLRAELQSLQVDLLNLFERTSETGPDIARRVDRLAEVLADSSRATEQFRREMDLADADDPFSPVTIGATAATGAIVTARDATEELVNEFSRVEAALTRIIAGNTSQLADNSELIQLGLFLRDLSDQLDEAANRFPQFTEQVDRARTAIAAMRTEVGGLLTGGPPFVEGFGPTSIESTTAAAIDLQNAMDTVADRFETVGITLGPTLNQISASLGFAEDGFARLGAEEDDFAETGQLVENVLSAQSRAARELSTAIRDTGDDLDILGQIDATLDQLGGRAAEVINLAEAMTQIGAGIDNAERIADVFDRLGAETRMGATPAALIRSWGIELDDIDLDQLNRVRGAFIELATVTDIAFTGDTGLSSLRDQLDIAIARIDQMDRGFVEGVSAVDGLSTGMRAVLAELIRIDAIVSDIIRSTRVELTQGFSAAHVTAEELRAEFEAIADTVDGRLRHGFIRAAHAAGSIAAELDRNFWASDLGDIVALAERLVTVLNSIDLSPLNGLADTGTAARRSLTTLADDAQALEQAQEGTNRVLSTTDDMLARLDDLLGDSASSTRELTASTDALGDSLHRVDDELEGHSVTPALYRYITATVEARLETTKATNAVFGLASAYEEVAAQIVVLSHQVARSGMESVALDFDNDARMAAARRLHSGPDEVGAVDVFRQATVSTVDDLTALDDRFEAMKVGPLRDEMLQLESAMGLLSNSTYGLGLVSTQVGAVMRRLSRDYMDTEASQRSLTSNTQMLTRAFGDHLVSEVYDLVRALRTLDNLAPDLFGPLTADMREFSRMMAKMVTGLPTATAGGRNAMLGRLVDLDDIRSVRLAVQTVGDLRGMAEKLDNDAAVTKFTAELDDVVEALERTSFTVDDVARHLEGPFARATAIAIGALADIDDELEGHSVNPSLRTLISLLREIPTDSARDLAIAFKIAADQADRLATVRGTGDLSPAQTRPMLEATRAGLFDELRGTAGTVAAPLSEMRAQLVASQKEFETTLRSGIRFADVLARIDDELEGHSVNPSLERLQELLGLSNQEMSLFARQTAVEARELAGLDFILQKLSDTIQQGALRDLAHALETLANARVAFDRAQFENRPSIHRQPPLFPHLGAMTDDPILGDRAEQIGLDVFHAFNQAFESAERTNGALYELEQHLRSAAVNVGFLLHTFENLDQTLVDLGDGVSQLIAHANPDALHRPLLEHGNFLNFDEVRERNAENQRFSGLSPVDFMSEPDFMPVPHSGLFDLDTSEVVTDMQLIDMRVQEITFGLVDLGHAWQRADLGPGMESLARSAIRLGDGTDRVFDMIRSRGLKDLEDFRRGLAGIDDELEGHSVNPALRRMIELMREAFDVAAGGTGLTQFRRELFETEEDIQDVIRALTFDIPNWGDMQIGGGDTATVDEAKQLRHLLKSLNDTNAELKAMTDLARQARGEIVKLVEETDLAGRGNALIPRAARIVGANGDVLRDPSLNQPLRDEDERQQAAELQREILAKFRADPAQQRADLVNDFEDQADRMIQSARDIEDELARLGDAGAASLRNRIFDLSSEIDEFMGNAVDSLIDEDQVIRKVRRLRELISDTIDDASLPSTDPFGLERSFGTLGTAESFLAHIGDQMAHLGDDLDVRGLAAIRDDLNEISERLDDAESMEGFAALNGMGREFEAELGRIRSELKELDTEFEESFAVQPMVEFAEMVNGISDEFDDLIAEARQLAKDIDEGFAANPTALDDFNERLAELRAEAQNTALSFGDLTDEFVNAGLGGVAFGDHAAEARQALEFMADSLLTAEEAVKDLDDAFGQPLRGDAGFFVLPQFIQDIITGLKSGIPNAVRAAGDALSRLRTPSTTLVGTGAPAGIGPGFSQKFTEAAAAANKFGSASRRATNEATQGIKNLVRNAAAGFGFYEAFRFFQSTIESVSSLTEQTNKVRVVFGESADAVLQFGKTATTALGQSNRAALESAGTFGNLLTSIGLPQEAAAGLSISLTRLATDLSSFNNIPVADAFEKLRSGITGEFEPLKSLGISLNETLIKQEALKLGLEATDGALDPLSKSIATYSLILKNTKNAQNDFINTQGSLANQTKILAAEFEDAKVQIGEALIPVALELVRAVRDALPTIVEFGKALVDVSVSVINVLEPAMRALVPVLSTIARVLDTVPPAALGAVAAFAGFSKLRNIFFGAESALGQLQARLLATAAAHAVEAEAQAAAAASGVAGAAAQAEASAAQAASASRAAGAIGKVGTALPVVGAALVAGAFIWGEYTKRQEEAKAAAEKAAEALAEDNKQLVEQARLAGKVADIGASGVLGAESQDLILKKLKDNRDALEQLSTLAGKFGSDTPFDVFLGAVNGNEQSLQRLNQALKETATFSGEVQSQVDGSTISVNLNAEQIEEARRLYIATGQSTVVLADGTKAIVNANDALFSSANALNKEFLDGKVALTEQQKAGLKDAESKLKQKRTADDLRDSSQLLRDKADALGITEAQLAGAIGQTTDQQSNLTTVQSLLGLSSVELARKVKGLDAVFARTKDRVKEFAGIFKSAVGDLDVMSEAATRAKAPTEALVKGLEQQKTALAAQAEAAKEALDAQKTALSEQAAAIKEANDARKAAIDEENTQRKAEIDELTKLQDEARAAFATITGQANSFADVLSKASARSTGALEKIRTGLQKTKDDLTKQIGDDATDPLKLEDLRAELAKTEAALEGMPETAHTSLDDFQTVIEEDLTKTATFITGVKDLLARGADDLAKFLLGQGRDAADAVAEAVGLSDSQLADQEARLERSQDLNREQVADVAKLVDELDGIDVPTFEEIQFNPIPEPDPNAIRDATKSIENAVKSIDAQIAKLNETEPQIDFGTLQATLTDQFDKSTLFFDNLQLLRDNDLDDLAEFFARQGIAGADALDALVKTHQTELADRAAGNEETLRQFDQQVADIQIRYDELLKRADDFAAKFGAAGHDAGENFRLDFLDGLKADQIAELIDKLGETTTDKFAIELQILQALGVATAGAIKDNVDKIFASFDVPQLDPQLLTQLIHDPLLLQSLLGFKFGAEGGIFTKATPMVIGEAGDEVLIPLSDPRRARQLANQSGLTRLLAQASPGAAASTTAAGTVIHIDQVLIQMVPAPGVTDSEANRQGQAAADGFLQRINTAGQIRSA